MKVFIIINLISLLTSPLINCFAQITELTTNESNDLISKIDENLSDLDEEIFERLVNVTEPNSEGVIIANPIKLIDTSDIFTGNFGVYRGSMTFPPCEPNINWLVSAMTFKIRRDQVRVPTEKTTASSSPI